jgi:hypothetical protein
VQCGGREVFYCIRLEEPAQDIACKFFSELFVWILHNCSYVIPHVHPRLQVILGLKPQSQINLNNVISFPVYYSMPTVDHRLSQLIPYNKSQFQENKAGFSSSQIISEIHPLYAREYTILLPSLKLAEKLSDLFHYDIINSQSDS